jgi:tryptophanyl-tRNA synthetase
MKEGAKIQDLQEPSAKMSKSSGSAAGVIELMDAPEVNVKKIKSAVTDTGREVKFDEKEKAGISNLLTIHSQLSGTSISDLEQRFEGKGYGDFKGEVAEVVVDYFAPIRKRALELLEDESALLKLLAEGAAKARAVASETISQTYKNLGLVQ